MQRMFASAMILWLAAIGAANAQTDPAQTNGVPANPQAAPATETTVPVTPPAPALESVPASDPLSVPTSTVPTTFAIPAPGSESTVGISGSASVNPQTAVQLPGEARNSSTQAPNTTASAPAAASSTPPPCSATIPTTTGEASVGGLFGGVSASGC